jgi:hypothetical protein
VHADGASEAPGQTVDTLARYRRWVTFFVTLVFLSGLLAVAFGPAQHPNGAVILVGAVMGMGVLGMVLLALDTQRPWALDSATRICVIVIILGVLRTLVELSFGRLNVPIDAIVSIAVLARRPPAGSLPTLAPADRQTAVLVAVGFLAAASLQIVAVIAQAPMDR